jgi:hypothetical protein
MLYNIATGKSNPIPVPVAGVGPVAVCKRTMMLAYRPSALNDSDRGYRQVHLVSLRSDGSSSSSSKPSPVLEGNAARIIQLAFTPSEDFLVAVDENQEIMVWKMFERHGEQAAFNPAPYWRSSTRFCCFDVNIQGADLSPLDRLLLQG